MDPCNLAEPAQHIYRLGDLNTVSLRTWKLEGPTKRSEQPWKPIRWAGQGSLLGEEGPAANAVQSPGAGIWKCGSPITSNPDCFRIPLSKTDSERTALPKWNRLAPSYLPTFARALRTKPDDKRGNLPKTAATAGDRCGLQQNGSKCLDLDSFG